MNMRFSKDNLLDIMRVERQHALEVIRAELRRSGDTAVFTYFAYEDAAKNWLGNAETMWNQETAEASKKALWCAVTSFAAELLFVMTAFGATSSGALPVQLAFGLAFGITIGIATAAALGAYHTLVDLWGLVRRGYCEGSAYLFETFGGGVYVVGEWNTYTLYGNADGVSVIPLEDIRKGGSHDFGPTLEKLMINRGETEVRARYLAAIGA